MASYNFLPNITTTNQTQTSAPSWAPQVGALTQAFGGAQNAYTKQLGMGEYQGDYIAAPNDLQYGAINQAAGFAQGPAAGVGNTQINQGRGLLDNYGLAGNAASGLYGYGSTNQTQNNINTANAYANNPYIDALVSSAMDDGQRVAAEQTLPSLYRGAAASGNLNSDRTALAEGVVKRGLGEMAAGMSAQVRGNMFNTGLNTALTQNQQGLGALSNAGSIGTSLGGAGSSMLSQGINDQQNLSNLYSGAGQSLNGLNQSFLDNAIARYQGRIQNMWSPVQNLYGIAGANNWGSTQNTQGTTVSMQPVANQQQSPGIAGYLGAGLGVAGTIAGMPLGPGGSALGGMLGSAAGSYLGSAFGSPSSGGMRFPVAAPGGGFYQGGWR